MRGEGEAWNLVSFFQFLSFVLVVEGGMKGRWK